MFLLFLLRSSSVEIHWVEKNLAKKNLGKRFSRLNFIFCSNFSDPIKSSSSIKNMQRSKLKKSRWVTTARRLCDDVVTSEWRRLLQVASPSPWLWRQILSPAANVSDVSDLLGKFSGWLYRSDRKTGKNLVAVIFIFRLLSWEKFIWWLIDDKWWWRFWRRRRRRWRRRRYETTWQLKSIFFFSDQCWKPLNGRLRNFSTTTFFRTSTNDKFSIFVLF